MIAVFFQKQAELRRKMRCALFAIGAHPAVQAAKRAGVLHTPPAAPRTFREKETGCLFPVPEIFGMRLDDREEIVEIRQRQRLKILRQAMRQTFWQRIPPAQHAVGQGQILFVQNIPADGGENLIRFTEKHIIDKRKELEIRPSPLIHAVGAADHGHEGRIPFLEPLQDGERRIVLLELRNDADNARSMREHSFHRLFHGKPRRFRRTRQKLTHSRLQRRRHPHAAEEAEILLSPLFRRQPRQRQEQPFRHPVNAE